MEAVLTEREKDEEKENEMESNCVKPKNPEQFVNQVIFNFLLIILT